MDKRFLFISLLTVGAWIPATSQAITAQIDVTATVVGSCAVQAIPIDFGVYSGTRIDTSGQVMVTCNAGVPFNVALDAGLHSDGANRMLSNGAGAMLPYRLTYAGIDWGDNGVTNTYPGDPVVGAGVGLPESFNVEARLFGNLDVPPGVYADTVTVTVAF
ncbi:MAG: spore coat U domain-containing protein [Gammaproteobacteria bacterium]|nr:spore coat U domain-containing protein [Gammaproteobacteria bacterium]